MNAEIHPSPDAETPNVTTVRSLKELIDIVSGRALRTDQPQEDSGLAEPLPFPFLALVGQTEMKLALMLAVINPLVSGVALIGPRGTGKTTAVRSLLDLLPNVEHSLCHFGCLPEDIEAGGVDAVCPDCAQKYAAGQPLTHKERIRLVELPLNAQLDDVVGGVDERAAGPDRMRLRRGILSHADKNILFVDEINLLNDEIINAILDAAAAGTYTVRRGPISATYRSRFILVGSLNPEEGSLRPQIMDRFGLRVIVRGLTDRKERMEAYNRVRAYRHNPRGTINEYAPDTLRARDEITAARESLKDVELPDAVAQTGLDLIDTLGIDSLRAEITLFEAARAYAAADGRLTVTQADMQVVAPMALRLRRSTFITQYIQAQASEEQEIQNALSQKSASTGENPS